MHRHMGGIPQRLIQHRMARVSRVSDRVIINVSVVPVCCRYADTLITLSPCLLLILTAL